MDNLVCIWIGVGFNSNANPIANVFFNTNPKGIIAIGSVFVLNVMPIQIHP